MLPLASIEEVKLSLVFASSELEESVRSVYILVNVAPCKDWVSKTGPGLYIGKCYGILVKNQGQFYLLNPCKGQHLPIYKLI